MTLVLMAAASRVGPLRMAFGGPTLIVRRRRVSDDRRRASCRVHGLGEGGALKYAVEYTGQLIARRVLDYQRDQSWLTATLGVP
jgi:hypothetical protein